MYSLAQPVTSNLEIRKSRFLACVEPIADRAAAQARVNELRVHHPGCAHVCWALLAGGHSAAVDDGEPSGTAGRPMLEVLRHQQLDGVLATVVRYFGGVKLGAGGLVRAYTDAVAQALLQAEKIEHIATQILCCELAYAHEGVARNLIAELGGELLEVSHGQAVRMQVSLPANAADALQEQLLSITRGELRWEVVVSSDG
ncbi:MAG TPA: YigZ family protein [Pseudomonas sabulinigri]|uniref:Impact N-terminal domain-containing protein n=1 Tax=marine sediment metagenome TaxID=412755 RepID=A0A0F9TIQ1_9ZZZZ|nr:YigZ family protein [Halopseudomonas sabulinigri]HEC50461.1 YigZ family protein [Halopseudomonas sabulinigri]